MATIKRKDICEKLAEDLQLSPELVDEVIVNFFEVFRKAILSGDKIELRNFGVFQLTNREAKVARNLKTNEPMHLPASKYLYFKPGKEMKQKVNNL